MKILVASDIHGKYDSFKKVVDFFINEAIDEMIVLGDIFSTTYDISVQDKSIINEFWTIADKICFCLGNNDSKYHEDLLPTSMNTIIEKNFNDKLICFSHGHLYIPNKNKYNIIVTGHTHKVELYKDSSIIYLNPGSVGRPILLNIGSFAVISDKVITIFDLNYNVIDELKL